MEAAPIVTLIGTAITVAAIAGYLIAIALILKGVFSRLQTILVSVSDVTEKTAPAGAVIDEINRDLAAGHKALEACVQRLQERRGLVATPQDPRIRPASGAAPFSQ